jgi:hypothetical protein
MTVIDAVALVAPIGIVATRSPQLCPRESGPRTPEETSQAEPEVCTVRYAVRRPIDVADILSTDLPDHCQLRRTRIQYVRPLDGLSN